MTASLPTPEEQTSAEVAAHAILELVATHPGQFGRLRTARLVSGYAVPLDDPDVVASTTPYTSVVVHWPLRDAVMLADALISGGLIAQTTGMRPTLVLTRAGHRSLDALEQTCHHLSA